MSSLRFGSTCLNTRVAGWLWQQHITLIRVGGGVVSGCSARWWESRTSPRWLPVSLSVPAETVCFCVGTCCGDRSEARSKTVLANEWQQFFYFFFLKSLQEKLLSVTVQPLEQELHSPCIYSKGCSAVWKVCVPFSFQTQGSPFLCGSWERKPQKFPLLSMHSAQNTLSGNTCSCLRRESAGSSAAHSHGTKSVALDRFASCPNATISSPKNEGN